MSSTDAKIYVFCCATSYDQVEITRDISHPGVETKVVLIPCSGKLDILYLTKAFETGADGVVVMICKEGECRYLEGNMRAKKRVEAVEKMLEEAGLGKGRIAVIQMKDDGLARAMAELEGFYRRIKDIKRNTPVGVSGK
jgi:F420-non-reducing hydrogenase iron-sulfur subunit